MDNLIFIGLKLQNTDLVGGSVLINDMQAPLMMIFYMFFFSKSIKISDRYLESRINKKNGSALRNGMQVPQKNRPKFLKCLNLYGEKKYILAKFIFLDL